MLLEALFEQAHNPGADISLFPSSLVMFLLSSLFLLREGHCWWWVPLLAPLIGGVIGAAIYKLLVELHHPAPPRIYMAPPTEMELEKGGTSEVCLSQA